MTKSKDVIETLHNKDIKTDEWNDIWVDAWEQGHTRFHKDEVNSNLSNYFKTCQKIYGHAFVPLCGKSHDLHFLASKCKKVTGVELAEKPILDFFNEAKLSYEKHHNKYTCKNIEILSEDIFKFLPSNINIDFIYDRAALVALPQELRNRYYPLLKKIISKKADLLLITCEYDENKKSGPPFSITESEVRSNFSDKNIKIVNSSKYIMKLHPKENLDFALEQVEMKNTCYLIS